MPDNSISYFQNSILKDGVARPSRYLVDVIAAGPQDENGNSQIHTFRKHPQSVTLLK